MPAKQPKRGRLWFNDGSCVRLRPAWKDHVWDYDILYLRLHDGTGIRLLTVIDEYSRACLAVQAARSIRSADAVEALAELMVFRGVPDHIRSDNGAEFTPGLYVSGLGGWEPGRGMGRALLPLAGDDFHLIRGRQERGAVPLTDAAICIICAVPSLT